MHMSQLLENSQVSQTISLTFYCQMVHATSQLILHFQTTRSVADDESSLKTVYFSSLFCVPIGCHPSQLLLLRQLHRLLLSKLFTAFTSAFINCCIGYCYTVSQAVAQTVAYDAAWPVAQVFLGSCLGCCFALAVPKAVAQAISQSFAQAVAQIVA